MLKNTVYPFITLLGMLLSMVGLRIDTVLCMLLSMVRININQI